MSDQFLRKVLGEDGPNCGWGNDLESIPIFWIRQKTKIHMAKLLTSTTYPFRTERNKDDDLSCDFRGLLTYFKNKLFAINEEEETSISQGNVNDKIKLLLETIKDNGSQITLKHLYGALEAIERYDVIEEMAMEMKILTSYRSYVMLLYAQADEAFAEWIHCRLDSIFQERNHNIKGIFFFVFYIFSRCVSVPISVPDFGPRFQSRFF